MISKNVVRREGHSVALTVQRYNREIALYEFFGKFFFGGKENFFCWCHGVTVSRCQSCFRECQRVHYIEINFYIVSRFWGIRIEFDTLTL